MKMLKCEYNLMCAFEELAVSWEGNFSVGDDKPLPLSVSSLGTGAVSVLFTLYPWHQPPRLWHSAWPLTGWQEVFDK